MRYDAIHLAARAAARFDFLARAEESALSRWPELSGYVRAHGIDLINLARRNILFGLTAVAFIGGRFEFVNEDEQDAERGAVIEAVGADAETVVDLVAWATDNPARFATYLGAAYALGAEHIANPATYFGGQVLRVFRTPQRWLHAQCRGVVILDPTSAPRWLAAAPGRLVGEDIEHAREIGRGLHPYFDPNRIGVLRPRKGKCDVKRA